MTYVTLCGLRSLPGEIPRTALFVVRGSCRVGCDAKMQLQAFVSVRYPCKWDGSSIIILGEVRIEAPYTTDKVFWRLFTPRSNALHTNLAHPSVKWFMH